MSSQSPSGGLALAEQKVRRASLVLFLLNAWVGLQLFQHSQLQLFGYEIGDVVGLPLAVLGIGLGLKLCEWRRSYLLGHWLVFLYAFGVFVTLIPYVTVHGYARYLQVLGWWRHWR